jgi:hypothetical protein
MTLPVFDASQYGSVAQPFLSGAKGAAGLAGLDAETLFPGALHPAEALAGLWLLFDDLDRSHSLSQQLSSPEAALWHGIMHRREPDAANAVYWFRRVGRHSVFPALRTAAATAGYSQPGKGWDPFLWIDFWDRARRKPGSGEHQLALAVQRVEWEILFDYCARPAKVNE